MLIKEFSLINIGKEFVFKVPSLYKYVTFLNHSPHELFLYPDTLVSVASLIFRIPSFIYLTLPLPNVGEVATCQKTATYTLISQGANIDSTNISLYFTEHNPAVNISFAPGASVANQDKTLYFGRPATVLETICDARPNKVITVKSLYMANKTAVDAIIDLAHNRGGVYHYLANSLVIPGGSTYALGYMVIKGNEYLGVRNITANAINLNVYGSEEVI